MNQSSGGKPANATASGASKLNLASWMCDLIEVDECYLHLQSITSHKPVTFLTVFNVGWFKIIIYFDSVGKVSKLFYSLQLNIHDFFLNYIISLHVDKMQQWVESIQLINPPFTSVSRVYQILQCLSVFSLMNSSQTGTFTDMHNKIPSNI